MLRALAFILLIGAALPATAGEEAKQQKIAELVRVTRLQDLFERQVADSRASYAAFGKRIFAQAMEGAEPMDPEKKARLGAILQRYIEHGLLLWRADELAEIWTSHYGEELSEDDLDQILIFFKSPIGQKTVAANQAATVALTAEVAARSQARIQEALQQLKADLMEEAKN